MQVKEEHAHRHPWLKIVAYVSVADKKSPVPAVNHSFRYIGDFVDAEFFIDKIKEAIDNMEIIIRFFACELLLCFQVLPKRC